MLSLDNNLSKILQGELKFIKGHFEITILLHFIYLFLNSNKFLDDQIWKVKFSPLLAPVISDP